jgi:hypothetical protein
VNQERPTGFESNNQILAPAIDDLHRLAVEFGSHFPGVVRPGQTGVEDGDALEPPPLQQRRKVRADRLDLG